MNLGIIGYPLGHTFSPAYFEKKFVNLGLTNYTYKVFSIENLTQEILLQLIIDNDLDGFNVTIPYKEKIVSFMDELSTDAQLIGAVNCVKVSRRGNEICLKGYNTDWVGFSKALRPFLNLHHHHALILGTGGASKAVAYALNRLGIENYFVSRNKSEAPNYFIYNALNENLLVHCKLIINTTPLGTLVDNICPDIPYQYLTAEHLLFDLVYNPTKTLFLKNGEKARAAIMNGLSMLHFQADEAWEIWQKKN